MSKNFVQRIVLSAWVRLSLATLIAISGMFPVLQTMRVQAAPDPAFHVSVTGNVYGLRALSVEDGTIDHPYIVTNAEQLDAVRNDLNAYYELGSDIDLSGIANWRPIGLGDFGLASPFTGHFDGQGHTISGLKISDNGFGNVGLFAVIGGGGVVQDLVLSDVHVAKSGFLGDTGALAGQLSGTASHIRVSGGTVAGINNVGGLVGSTYAGAFIETSNTEVRVESDASSSGNNAGGLVGSLTGGTINASCSTGEVVGYYYAGGLAGMIRDSEINASCSTGAVSGSYDVGGLVGMIENSAINDSYATGDVSGTDSFAMGIGGLIGGVSWTGHSTATNVYASGEVEGPEGSMTTGGLIGDKFAGATLTSAFYDKENTGQSDREEASGTPVTSADMAKETTFAGWDFDTLWHLDDRIGSPTFLRDDNMAPIMSGAKISNDTPNQVSVYFPETIEAEEAAIARFHVSVNGDEALIAGTQLNGKELLLTLGEPVLNGQTVTVAYTDGDPAVTDKAHNRMANGTIQADNEVEPHVAIVSYAPADNATGVAVDEKLVLTFNDSVEALPGKFIYLMTEGGAVVEKIEANSPNVQVMGKVVTIKPAANLLPLEGYYVLIDAGAFRHAVNDVYGGIAKPTTWNFMTAANPSAKWVPAGQAGFTGGKASSPALQAGVDGTLYALFRDQAHGGRATVMKLGANEAEWSPVGSAGFSSGAIGVPSLLVDGDVLYAAFGVVGENNSASVHVMKYELDGAGDWTQAGSPIAVGIINPDLLMDQDSAPFLLAHDGAVHIAYRDGTVTGKMTVKKLNGSGNWETIGNAGFSAGDIYDPSLAVMGGALYAGFTDYTFEAGYGATVMKFNTVSGRWELVGPRGFTSGNAFDTSLVSDGSRLYVVYGNSVRKASAMTFDSAKGEWVTVGSAGFSVGQAYGIAATAANGGLYAAYQDAGRSDRITMMKYTGSGWVAVGTAGFTPGKGFAPSLIVHGGVPYVVYEDRSADAKLSAMKYGSFNLAPKAANVRIEGTLRVGQTVTGEYDFTDDEDDEQGESLYRWYMADNEQGLNRKIISGATERTLELTEGLAGKYLVFEVTPAAAQGTPQGTSAASAPAGPVASLSAPAAPSVTADDVLNLIVGADATMEYSTDGGTTYTAYDPSNPPTFPGNVTVKVRVAANAVTGTPAGADTTLTFTTNPPAPLNLTSTAGDRQVTLNWNAVTGTVSYAVYKYEGATAPADPSGWVLVQTHVTATTYTVTGLTNGTTYAFAVTASNAGGTSDYSAITTAKPTAALPPAPPAPSNLTSATGDRQVTLNWDAVTGTVSYAVYQYEGTTAPTDTSNWVLVQANVTATTYTVTGLTNGTTYAFAVKAIHEGSTSDFSNIATATPRASSSNGGSGGGGDGGSSGGETGIITSTNGAITIPADRAGEVSLDREIIIKVPNGVAEQELRITIEGLNGTSDLLTDQETLVSPVFEVLKNFSGNFKKPVRISIKFDPTKVGNNQKVAIFYYDEERKTWIEVGGIVNGEWITAEVDHFTKYAVLAIDMKKNDGEETPKQPDSSFTDIAGHWGENSIIRAAAQKLVSGYPDGTFKPNNPVTRAEFTVMLVGALKLDDTGAALTFTDQDKIGFRAKRAVALAVQAGIVSGYDDGSFRPDAQITRAEMASMIAKSLKVHLDSNTTTRFTDDEDIPKWVKGAVEAIRKLGIVSGRGGNKFVPNDTATRAEAVVMLLRMLEVREQE